MAIVHSYRGKSKIGRRAYPLTYRHWFQGMSRSQLEKHISKWCIHFLKATKTQTHQVKLCPHSWCVIYFEDQLEGSPHSHVYPLPPLYIIWQVKFSSVFPWLMLPGERSKVLYSNNNNAFSLCCYILSYTYFVNVCYCSHFVKKMLAKICF